MDDNILDEVLAKGKKDKSLMSKTTAVIRLLANINFLIVTTVIVVSNFRMRNLESAQNNVTFGQIALLLIVLWLIFYNFRCGFYEIKSENIKPPFKLPFVFSSMVFSFSLAIIFIQIIIPKINPNNIPGELIMLGPLSLMLLFLTTREFKYLTKILAKKS